MGGSAIFHYSERQRATGLAIIRVVVGIVYLVHGWQKLTQMGHGGVTGYFTEVGAPLPAVSAALIMFIETAGALALIAGAFTRVAALGLACDSLGAIVLVHYESGFFAQSGGVELVLTLFSAALALAIAGPGAASIDEWLERRRAS